MVSDPIPDIGKIGPKLKEGWETMRTVLPFLPLVGVGVALSALLALWLAPNVMHKVFPIPNYVILLDTYWFWAPILIVLLAMAVVGVGGRVLARVKDGVEKAQPSVLGERYARQFLGFVGSLDQTQQAVLVRVIEQGMVVSDGPVRALAERSHGIIVTHQLDRYRVAERFDGVAKLWFEHAVRR